MKPAVFSYHDPQALAEVLDLLSSCGDEAKLLAGGQSLIPLMNMRLARPEHVIDLRRVPGLAGVEPDATSVRVGAMVRHRRVETEPELRSVNPLLAEAAGHISHVQIRERGTLGGALAHADPAGEMPLVATVLDARFAVHSARGERSLTSADFFESVFTSSSRSSPARSNLTRCWSRRCSRAWAAATAGRSRRWRAGTATSPSSRSPSG